MRVLFLMTHAGLFRLFESTLRELLERGHEVRLSLDSDRYPSDALAALEASCDRLTVSVSPAADEDEWGTLGRHVRGASDYLRYLAPEYREAPALRARALKQVPVWLRPVARSGRGDAVLRGVEARLPVNRDVAGLVAGWAPDVVVVSSLFGSVVQLEGLRAARALGVPSCLVVASWDNLTNKGLVREVPGSVVVWNRAQVREAVELHGVPAERVVVTGAPSFDEWFGRTPALSRGEFMGRLGLRADRPFVLYAGSSSFIAPDEASFVAEWLERLRADPELHDVGVLLRPHPQNARGWDRRELTEAAQVAVWPPPDLAPQQTGRADWSREGFYASMLHAAAVVGVNTTAMIDSAVLGKAVHTILAPRFRGTQTGTLHFEHLRSAGGGLLHVGEDWQQHLDGLARSVERAEEPDERSRRFVEAFVRPHGLDRPATPLVADAVEAAARRPAAPQPPRPARGLRPLARLAVGSEQLHGRLRKRRLKLSKWIPQFVALVRERLRPR